MAPLEDDVLRALVDTGAVAAHRARALDPDRPVVRGTSQNPDAYFQAREAIELFYARFPRVLDDTMARFAELTGRRYRAFEYVGDPEAERVVVLMGSGAECAHELVEQRVEQGEKIGIVKVRLFRPFSTGHLLAVLPASTRAIAVLDRTKEPGSSGEPLYQELATALLEAARQGERSSMPRIVSGRYGLASKDLTPAIVSAVFENLALASPKHRFTVGIRDDVSQSSLTVDASFDIEPDDPEFLERRDVLEAAMPGATVLLNTSAPLERVWGPPPLSCPSGCTPSRACQRRRRCPGRARAACTRAWTRRRPS